TVHGPHRDELALRVAGRSIRTFGSQGQQRLALLALILAERDVLATARRALPILLLDDVFSELDADRRARLLDLLGAGGQTLITPADPAAVDFEALHRIGVENGEVESLPAGAAL